MFLILSAFHRLFVLKECKIENLSLGVEGAELSAAFFRINLMIRRGNFFKNVKRLNHGDIIPYSIIFIARDGAAGIHNCTFIAVRFAYPA
jgi:hypothetical protein